MFTKISNLINSFQALASGFCKLLTGLRVKHGH